MKWNLQYDKLVEFRKQTGHCIVPRGYEQDKAFARWVSKQRCNHNKNTIQLDRKKLLVEIGFVWKGQEKRWHEQYLKLVEFIQINGHSMVPKWYAQDKALGRWVSKQRCNHNKNTIQLDRKELLDAIGIVWRVAPVAAHTSTTNDVRGLVIGSFQLI